MTIDFGAMLSQIVSDPTSQVIASTATTGGTAAAVSTYATNIVKRVWGGKDGNPPDWVPLVCAGAFGIAGVALLYLAAGKDLSHPALMAETALGGLLAGGGGATAIAASYKVARPNSINIAKMEELAGPCCGLPACRYNKVPTPVAGGEPWTAIPPSPYSGSSSGPPSYGGAPVAVGATDLPSQGGIPPWQRPRL